MATFSQSMLAQGSDSVIDFCCSPCLEQNTYEWAEFYCDKCLKLYCGNCINLHDQLFVKHVAYGRGNTSKWPVSKEVEDFLQKCGLHKDKCLKMYCDDHSQLCCTNCAFLNHRQCAKVTLISELVKGPPPDLQQLSRKIQSIIETLKTLQNNWTTNMQSVEASYNKQLHEIQETRQKINTILDEMENTCMNERDDKMTSLKASLRTDLDDCSKLQDELRRLSEAIQHVVDKSKAELAFIVSTKGLVKIKISETYLQENYVKLESLLTFQANSDIQQYLSKLSGLAGLDNPVFTFQGMSTLTGIHDEEELEEDESNTMLRSNYTEDQWSIMNPEDKKLFTKEFPLQGQRKSVTTTKPTYLPDIVLHKAEKAWKPGHLKPMTEADIDEATELYKKTRSILNRVTPQKFQVLLSQMNALKINTESQLIGVVDLVFEKAISELNFSVVYANMCRCLSMFKVHSDSKSNEMVTFRTVLLMRCQQEFENDKSSEAEFLTNRVKNAKCDDSSKKMELKLKLEHTESKSKQRSQGNCRFLGELFKLKMFTANIMHDCLYKLFRSKDLACFCMLLTTIGKELNSDKSMPRMDQYFQHMDTIVNDKTNPAKERFMLQDVIDLRRNNWIPRRIDSKHPKTIDQIRKEIAQENL